MCCKNRASKIFILTCLWAFTRTRSLCANWIVAFALTTIHASAARKEITPHSRIKAISFQLMESREYSPSSNHLVFNLNWICFGPKLSGKHEEKIFLVGYESHQVTGHEAQICSVFLEIRVLFYGKWHNKNLEWFTIHDDHGIIK